MKMFTRIAAVAALSTFMFAGMNITWGNNYAEDTAGNLASTPDFGVWFDMNDATSIGWDGGLKVGLAGPAGMTFRLGYDSVTTLGVGRSWWSSTGNGWATSLNTTLDFTLVESAANAGDAGAFSIGVNLGMGF